MNSGWYNYADGVYMPFWKKVYRLHLADKGHFLKICSDDISVGMISH